MVKFGWIVVLFSRYLRRALCNLYLYNKFLGGHCLHYHCPRFLVFGGGFLFGSGFHVCGRVWSFLVYRVGLVVWFVLVAVGATKDNVLRSQLQASMLGCDSKSQGLAIILLLYVHVQ